MSAEINSLLIKKKVTFLVHMRGLKSHTSASNQSNPSVYTAI